MSNKIKKFVDQRLIEFRFSKFDTVNGMLWASGHGISVYLLNIDMRTWLFKIGCKYSKNKKLKKDRIGSTNIFKKR